MGSKIEPSSAPRSDLSSQNPPKIEPESIQNRSKIDLGESGRPRIDSGAPQEAAGTHPERPRTHSGRPKSALGTSWAAQDCLQERPGGARGTSRNPGGRPRGTNCSTEVRTPKASFNRGINVFYLHKKRGTAVVAPHDAQGLFSPPKKTSRRA